ncbi:uncharacterized protein [Clytia hemisphaerica]|uniref:Uncharacterized protein n=1 Tax=Clytia hemisphaerica TaxID=252671 RepID=A0A7M5XIN2_9CNID
MYKNLDKEAGSDEPVDIKQWERKRYWTTKAFTLECIMLGMEYSVTFLTLWLYIKEMINTDQPKLFYSLVASSYLIAAVILSVFIGRWVDRTRKVRQIFLICNTLVIIGNIMYAFHFSPWFLVFGRLVSGADGPLRSVISGEIARCYPDSEVLSRFSSMGMAFALGFIVGPGVNFMFTTVDFNIGAWHVTYVNIPGVYMALFFFITQICVFFMVHDLSREYDLKADAILKPILPGDIKPLPVTTSFFYAPSNANTQSQSDRFTKSVQIPVKPKETTINFYDDTLIETALRTQQEQERRNKFKMQRLEMSGMFIRPFAFPKLASNQVVPVITEDSSLTSSSSSNYSSISSSSSTSSDEQSKADHILCTILTNADSLLILALTFILWYWMVAFDMWLPIMVVDVMEMSITELNGIVFGFGCISAVILGIMSLKSFSDRMLYNLSIICMIALALMELIFIYMRFRHSQMYINIVLWIIWGTLFAIVVIMDEVFLVGVMAKMTSSKVQTFSESLRLSMSRFGALLALLTSAALFEWIEYVCGVGVIVSLLTLVILIKRRKSLRAPVICIK